MPIALAPTEGGIDARGTFTGGVLPTEVGAAVIYTAVAQVDRAHETIRAEGLREVQSVATSTDPDLREWKKRDEPVISSPPRGLGVTGFRDPFAWKDGDTWYMGVGTGFPRVGGAVLLYRSKDMANWEYLHPLAQGSWNGKLYSNPVPSGEMWECPDFFPLGDRHVLIYSTEHTTRWEVGTFDKAALRFFPEKKGILDHGHYYAPRSMADGTNRRLLWGWVQEGRDSKGAAEAGWSGCISLPRVLTLDKNSALLMQVAPELASLRRKTAVVRNPRDVSSLNDWLSRTVIHNRAGEILCQTRAGTDEWTLEVQAASDSSTTPILAIACVHANQAPCIAMGDKLIPLSPDESGISTLHVWIDGSVIEVFIDHKEAVTVRDYSSLNSGGELRIFWRGSASSLQKLSISDIEPISADRLTT
jgi:beta-fructofuranosidase